MFVCINDDLNIDGDQIRMTGMVLLMETIAAFLALQESLNVL